MGRDVASPGTPVGLTLVCNTNGSVSASWSSATDTGCGGLHSYPYWTRLSTDLNFSTVYSDSSWQDTWKSGTTKSTNAAAFGPGVRVYGKTRSRDVFDQQSAWTTASLDDSCVVPTAIPSPTPGTPSVSVNPSCTNGNSTWTWSAVTPPAASYDIQRSSDATAWD